jgi:hypothetical protein
MGPTRSSLFFLFRCGSFPLLSLHARVLMPSCVVFLSDMSDASFVLFRFLSFFPHSHLSDPFARPSSCQSIPCLSYSVSELSCGSYLFVSVCSYACPSSPFRVFVLCSLNEHTRGGVLLVPPLLLWCLSSLPPPPPPPPAQFVCGVLD